MTNLFLPNEYARITNYKVEASGVRAYKDSPFTVHLQIRVKGNKVGKIASLNLTKNEAIDLANHIWHEAAELQEER